ncbi:hypothetical protein A2V61_01360 [Candidatus Woesebacteria bacterium RBG_19FT_COMBO_47_8]|uniref:Ferric oxidoreductase domain-containing protein n=1 Tax=Candidatus Woesebacteria bacterium RBG_13_46_13 TaxID=1802479 RepID=A0A1F7X4S7_9BACT|nr:MAG: hypothetical protein A2Y68_03810 [Candidatus Woesebacteria bacterium RBG_13_46_13]OGM18199.1 MAG: hypothetical protein A2V61_01360 [Candidatus Woesebacteria bacterium RBG_19FT_COMBO_47_8]HJX58926.1 hypothetical protein [Patescibacteria group bacterium]
MNKKLFLLVWLLSILLGPVTVLIFILRSPVPLNNLLVVNLIQRVVGLVAFVLLFWQVVLGSFMQKWIEKLGAWVFKWHLTEGAVAYSLILLHPLALLVFNYIARHVIDPFYVFTDFCLMCKTRPEFFYTLGRLSFWLVSAAVLAAKLRTLPWWRENWRKFHILNYAVFLLVAVHSFFIGSDSRSFPFVIFYIFSVPAVLYIIAVKLISYLKTS